MPYRFAMKAADVPSGRSRIAVVDGKKVLVSNRDGDFVAYVNACTHQGGGLRYERGRIVCNWHGAEFDAATGEATKGPASEGSKLERIDVRREGDDLLVELKEKARSPWADDF